MDAYQTSLTELDGLITTLQDYHCGLEMGEDFDPSYVLDLTTRAGILISEIKSQAKGRNALALAKERLEWMEQWRAKKEDADDQELSDHYAEMNDLCRADVIAYTAIAQAEQLKRIADALYVSTVSGAPGYSLADMVHAATPQ